MPRASKPAPGPLSLEVASLLRAEMGRQSLSKAELARRAHLDRTMVSDIVRGLQRADVEDLDSICQALDISLTEVLRKAEAESDARRLV
jgi:transcriptional regulator with XRE-family HTH domain